MRRLFMTALSVVGIGLVVSLLWLGLPVLFELCERNHLIMATWVMAVFTVMLAIFTIVQGIATWGQLKAFREAQTWDRLRKHSETLMSILISWRESIPDSFDQRKLVKPSETHFVALWEHMKTGYKKDVETWERLGPQINDISEKRGNLFNVLEDEMKRRVRLPTFSFKGKEPEEWFHSRKCAQMAFDVLTGRIEANYYLKDNIPRIEKHESGRYMISWPLGDVIAMTNNRTECTVLEQAITDLMKEPKIVSEGIKLQETACDINERLGNFKERLKKIISVIELGGILEGDCEYCERLKLR